MTKFLCVGQALCDLYLHPAGPEIFDGRQNHILDSIPVMGGGDANNASIDLARLGEDVRIVSRVGGDFLGQMLTTLLSQNGVDTRYVARDEHAETTAAILMLGPDGVTTISARHSGTALFASFSLMTGTMPIAEIFAVRSITNRSFSPSVTVSRSLYIISLRDTSVFCARPARRNGFGQASLPPKAPHSGNQSALAFNYRGSKRFPGVHLCAGTVFGRIPQTPLFLQAFSLILPPQNASFGEPVRFCVHLLRIKVFSGWGLGRRLFQKGGLLWPRRCGQVKSVVK